MKKSKVRRLIAALDYRDHVCGIDGRVYDLGVPVRRDAALALASVGDPGDEELLSALIRALGDRSDEVRSAAAATLGSRRDPAAVLPLTEAALGKEDPRYTAARIAAAESLIALTGPGAIEQVVEEAVRRPGDPQRAGHLVERMAHHGGSETTRRASAAAAAALSHAQDGAAQRSVELLVRLGEESVDPLLALLAGPPAVRISATSALGRLGDLRASEPLVGLLADRDAAVRAAAATALGQLADPSAVHRLLEASGDHDHEVREAALEALKKLAPLTLMPDRERHHWPAAESFRSEEIGVRHRALASWFRG